MRACLSHGGPTLHRSDGPALELLVGSTGGVVFLERSSCGEPWRVTGRTLQDKDVSALIFEPERGVLLAGTHGDFTERRGDELFLLSAGDAISGIDPDELPPRTGDYVYVSTDDGDTWERRSRGIDYPDVYSMNCVRAGGEVRVYAGTEPAHLYVTTDYGAAWRELPALHSVASVPTWNFPAPPHVAHVKNITFHPQRPDTIYASIEQGGLLQSDDAGATWTEFQGFYDDVHRMVSPMAHPERMFITGGKGMWLSEDAGGRWEHHDGMPIAYADGLVIHPERNELMFCSGAGNVPSQWPRQGTAGTSIVRSRDSGRTW